MVNSEQLKFIKNLHDTEIKGFGGYCGIFAAALKTTLFPEATIIGAFNEALAEHEHYIGHVALMLDGSLGRIYLDFDGVPKEEEHITSWAELDSEDPDYQELMLDNDVALSEYNFYNTIIMEMTINEAINVFQIDNANDLYENYVHIISTFLKKYDLNIDLH